MVSTNMAAPTDCMETHAAGMAKDAMSPVEKFNAIRSDKKFVFLLFYRGHWCPFCMSYIRTLQSLSSQITKAGGTTIICTAENPSFLPDTLKQTSYLGDVIVDPENLLAAEVKVQYGLDVAISSKGGYPKGMAQPAILVLGKDGTVLEKWAIVPGVMNIGGAKDRPEMQQVWENAEAKLNGKERVHQKYTITSFFAVIKQKFFS